MKHTPGPWVAYNSDGNGRILKKWHIKGACVRNEPSFATIDSGGKILPEYEAGNARLIASAPELLEALKLACETLRARGEGGIAKHCEIAIAKAEGVFNG